MWHIVIGAALGTYSCIQRMYPISIVIRTMKYVNWWEGGHSLYSLFFHWSDNNEERDHNNSKFLTKGYFLYWRCRHKYIAKVKMPSNMYGAKLLNKTDSAFIVSTWKDNWFCSIYEFVVLENPFNSIEV